jgi:hypothetical protein
LLKLCCCFARLLVGKSRLRRIFPIGVLQELILVVDGSLRYQWNFWRQRMEFRLDENRLLSRTMNKTNSGHLSHEE